MSGTDRGELVERWMHVGEGYPKLPSLKLIADTIARIQADAATIAAAKRVLEWWPENSELASRAGKEKGLSFAKDIQALRAALNGGGHD